MSKILVCDDEPDIVSALRIYLTGQGWTVTEGHDGRAAVQAAERGEADLILLDIMMPVMDGITATVKIREFSNVPIILLTAKSESQDVILGLDMGADDYITKPFVPGEVIARVRSQLRRFQRLGGGPASDSRLSINGLELDPEGRTVTADGENVELTPTEFDILKLLMSSPGKVFSPDDIYRRVKGEEPYGSESAVAVHVRHIREKTEIDPSHPRYIKVVWGQGYKMEVQKER